MTARLWHLVRTEARSHRGALGLWLLLLAWVAAGSIANVWIHRHLTWADQRRIEGTFLDHLRTWNFNNVASVDSWLWLGAGLLASWIWLADPLQSPNAFWVTRPVRLKELILARAVLCLGFFVVVPMLLVILSARIAGATLHDTLLSAISFGLVRAGLVPVGFWVGAFWPAPGRRWLALLPALGWWGGLVACHALGKGGTDFEDHSWKLTLLWLVGPLTLVLMRYRRSLWSQGLLTLLAFAIVGSAALLRKSAERPAFQSAAAAGVPSLQVSGEPVSFDLLPGSSAQRKMEVKLRPVLKGVPPEIAAEVTAWQLVMTPGSTATPSWPEWRYSNLVHVTFYGAIAHAMNVAPENFPAEWRQPERFLSVSLPAGTFDSWKEHQQVKITGKVRLRLMRPQQDWRGIFHKELSEGPGALRLNQSAAEISTQGEVRWWRPWMADNVMVADTTDRGVLFNPLRTFWFVTFQPPQKLPEGKFTTNLSRTPPLWAMGQYQGTYFFSSRSGSWLGDTASSVRIENFAPELHEVSTRHDGLDGLPVALMHATVFAELEMPLEPLTLTKQQILDTRKVSPARP